MSLIPAKCTNCGANINVDEYKDAGICEFCGCAFVTEKAINNYTTNITNNIVNNNNFNGANVTIQDDDNVDGLLRLAKRELQSKHYGSKKLFEYLDEIILKSSDGIKQIIELFRETGIYEIVDFGLRQDKYIDDALEIINLVTRYDQDNIDGWLWSWKWHNGDWLPRSVNMGENIIRLSSDSDKAMYEKEVYYYFIEHGSQCNAYRKYFSAVPKEYIMENSDIQDLIIKVASTINRQSSETEKSVVNCLTEMLPESRRGEISRKDNNVVPQNTNGGCYIATCVYGSYDCPQVWTLRRFRDYTLDVKWYGRLFVKCYYAISPKLVKMFGNKKWFRVFWKTCLDIMVQKLNNNGVERTRYQDKY
ncbi:MAG: hypothetical protein IJZ53_07805 [Tyzzerella sp.]|nr:hypothetical protein [Tyzzerella sp.]